MFWKRFYELCLEHKKTPNGVCRELGFSNATASYWKQGKFPRQSALKIIADYFDVSVEYLLGAEEKKPVQEDEPGQDLVVVHRNGKRITYHITDEKLKALEPLLKELEANSDDIDL